MMGGCLREEKLGKSAKKTPVKPRRWEAVTPISEVAAAPVVPSHFDKTAAQARAYDKLHREP